MARGCLGDGGQQVPGGSWHGWRRASCMCLHVQTLPWVSSHAVTEVSEQAVYQRASFPPLLLLPLSLFRSVSLTSWHIRFSDSQHPPTLSVQQNWSYRSTPQKTSLSLPSYQSSRTGLTEVKKKLTFKSPTLSVRQNWSYRSTEKPFFKSPTLSVQQNWSYKSTPQKTSLSPPPYQFSRNGLAQVERNASLKSPTLSVQQEWSCTSTEEGFFRSLWCFLTIVVSLGCFLIKVVSLESFH